MEIIDENLLIGNFKNMSSCLDETNEKIKEKLLNIGIKASDNDIEVLKTFPKTNDQEVIAEQLKKLGIDDIDKENLNNFKNICEGSCKISDDDLKNINGGRGGLAIFALVSVITTLVLIPKDIYSIVKYRKSVKNKDKNKNKG